MFSVLKKIEHYYPLSALGTLAAAAGVGLLIVFFKTANPLSLFFAIGFIVTVGGLAVLGRVFANRLYGVVLEWNSSRPPVADSLEETQFVNLERASLFPFFSLHFRLSGKLKVGRRAYIHVREEHPLVRRKDGRLPVPLYFPLSGVLQAKGRFLFRDLLGLTRTFFGREDERELSVLPPGVDARKMQDFITSQGFEDSIRKRSQDEERYFMREYVPGDRIRDINWKASSRLSQLITKIAPVTQEQTKSIVVFFRNIKADPGESLETIVHLNRLKSLLLSFLRYTKRAAPEFVFHVIGAAGKFTLENEDEIERFALALAGWEYEPAPTAAEYDPNIGEIFVFSTQYDRELSAFLAVFERARATVVQTVTVPQTEKAAHTLFRLFVPFRAALIPGRFIFRREPPARLVPLAAMKNLVYERDPIEIRLW